MSVLCLILFLYGAAMTAALMVTNSTKDKYIRKYLDTKKMYEDLQKKLASQNTSEEGKTQAAPSISSAPAAAPVPSRTEAQIMQRQPLPSYSSVPKKEPGKPGLGAVGVSFAVGVLLMVIAAAVFISATWQTMPAGIKCLVLALIVGIVYGFSVLCRRRLKLDKTSSVLYMLGSLITPLAVFVGFLAFDNHETSIILSCCALSLGITGFTGYKIYGSKLQVAISYIGFVWMDIFLCMDLFGSFNGFVVGLCFASLVSAVIHTLAPKLKFFGVFAECTAYASSIAFFMSADIRPEMMAAAITSQIMYWIALLLLNRRRGFIKFFSAVVPAYSLLYLWIGNVVTDPDIYALICALGAIAVFAVYKFVKQENPGSNAIVAVVIPLILYTVYDGVGPESLVLHYVAMILPVVSALFVIIVSRFKWEKSVYVYLLFAFSMVLAEDLMTGILPFAVFLCAALVSVLLAMKLKLIHIPAASCAAAFVSAIIHANSMYKQVHWLVIFAALTVAVYGVIVFLRKRLAPSKGPWLASRFSLLGLLLLSNYILQIRSINESGAAFWALIVIDIAFFVITLFDTDNYFGILPASSFMLVTVVELFKRDADELTVGIIFMLVFVVLGRIFVCEHFARKGRLDWLTILAGIACFIPMQKFYMTTFLLSFFILSFTGRFSRADSVEERIKSNIRVILSAAVGLFFVSLAIVDVKLIDNMDFELRLLFLLMGAFAVRFVINPGPSARWIWFSTVAFCLELEAIKAVVKGDLLPLTLVSVLVCGLFIYSFIAKTRSWFILAITNIGLIGIIFAITYWESKLWWIYLLVLGGILIGTASFNEYRRRKALESGLEDKKIRIFDSWKW